MFSGAALIRGWHLLYLGVALIQCYSGMAFIWGQHLFGGSTYLGLVLIRGQHSFGDGTYLLMALN